MLTCATLIKICTSCAFFHKRLWSQMMGSWQVQLDTNNASNKVLRQEATQITLDNWPDRVRFKPLTVIGMREWQDVKLAVKFRLPATGFSPAWPAETAGACLATRTAWVGHNGLYFCISANGVWTLTYSAPYDDEGIVANGTVVHPPKGDAAGSWHTMSLTTLQGSASGTYDDAPIFTNLTIRDVDTGFAALGVTGYHAVEFDDVAVEAVGYVHIAMHCDVMQCHDALVHIYIYIYIYSGVCIYKRISNFDKLC